MGACRRENICLMNDISISMRIRNGTVTELDIAIVGNKGSGKTLLLTALGCYELEHGKTVFATYHISFVSSDGRRIEKVDIGRIAEEFETGKRPKLPMGQGLLLMDEGYRGMDSYHSRSKANLIIVDFVMQARKVGLDCYYTTQRFKRLDVNLRLVMDYKILAEKIGDEGFLYNVLNQRYVSEDEFVISLDEAKEIWQYYDSTEVVLPPEISLKKDEAKKMGVRLVKHQIEQVNK